MRMQLCMLHLVRRAHLHVSASTLTGADSHTPSFQVPPFVTEPVFPVRPASFNPCKNQALLSALVNKLGDPSRKLASDAAFLLGQLLLQHPAMKMVVVREVRLAKL